MGIQITKDGAPVAEGSKCGLHSQGGVRQQGQGLQRGPGPTEGAQRRKQPHQGLRLWKPSSTGNTGSAAATRGQGTGGAGAKPGTRTPHSGFTTRIRLEQDILGVDCREGVQKEGTGVRAAEFSARTQVQAAEMGYQAGNSRFRLQGGGGSSEKCWVHIAERGELG